MTTKILVALHPNGNHEPALDRTAAIARQSDAEVMLYSAMYNEYLAGTRFGDGVDMNQARTSMVEAEIRHLEKLKEKLGLPKNKVHVNASWNYPAGSGIVDAALQFDANLIIVSSTQHAAVTRLFMSNTDWEVLRTATIPVLFAHHRDFRPYKTVLAAVDPLHAHDKPAALDHCLVERATWAATLFDGAVHLGHAYPSIRTVMASDFGELVEVDRQWRERHRKVVHTLADDHGIPHERVHLADDQPSDAITVMAQELDADLVVMGVVSRSLLSRMIIGRTAERVLDRLSCDVLTVQLAKDALPAATID